MSNPNIKNIGFSEHPENIVAGRKKGVKNRSTILKKWIEVAVKIKEKGNPTGKEITGIVEDQIKLALITKALTGDVQAIKEIDDTLYGKIPDKGEIKTDSTINITFTRNGT